MVRSSLHSYHGFSLMELLVIIIVIGILASVALQSMGGALENARKVKTEREMDMLAKAIVGDPSITNGQYRTDFGYVGDIGAFPSNLDALVTNPGLATWDGPYVDPGLVEDIDGFKLDEWGSAYAFSGGTTITSTGGGTPISKKIVDATEDYLQNRVLGSVRDIMDSLPGLTYQDSVEIAITVPDGAGGTLTRTCQPNATGGFLLDSLPVGQHPLRVIFTPDADTLIRYLTVLPRHKSAVSFQFATACFSTPVAATPPPDTVMFADFNSGPDGFVYEDDAFRGTSQPSYADGGHTWLLGHPWGGLWVTVGDNNNSAISDMSGGYRVNFTLSEAGNVIIKMDYKLDVASSLDAGEHGQILVSINDSLIGSDPDDYIIQVAGDEMTSTDWLIFQKDIGNFPPGVYTLRVGVYLDHKDYWLESATGFFDNILVAQQ